MTREQRKQRERLTVSVLAVSSVAGLALGCTLCGYDRGAAYVSASACAAVTVSHIIMRVVYWLDTPRGKRHV